MNITLEDLAAKRVKSAEGLVVSDHTLDLAKYTGGQLVITGKGARGLVFKNSKNVIILFKDCVIDNASTGVTLKFDGVSDNVGINGSGSTKLFGKAGNSASQMIYFVGTWSNVVIGGFEIDQRRNSNTGSTTTGACVQLQGVISSTHNLGSVYIHDLIIKNAGDEGVYANHFQFDGGYAQGDELVVENVKVFNSGRDYLQQWGFKKATYRNCYGENGGLEADANHCSALSMNGNTESLLIEDCEFKNVAQLIYSGKPTASVNATLRNVKYTQGTHAGARSNQAAYLKGPGSYEFENCVIDASSAKEAAITADGCKVTYSNCKITAPKVSRVFNGGDVDEVPSVKSYPVTAEVEETTLAGVTTKVLLYEGKSFVI